MRCKKARYFANLQGSHMKLTFVTVLVGIGMVLGQGSRAATLTPSEEDREQIVRVFEALDETWNRHDMAGHAALFHKDGVWIAWTGQLLNGAAEYEAALTPLHKTIFKDSVHDDHIEDMTFAAPNVAVIRGYGTVTGNKPAPERTERYRILLVMTKREGIWKIGWGQKTRLLDSTPDPAPRK